MTDRQGNRRGPTPVVYGVPTSHGHRDDAPDTSDETTVQPRVAGGSRTPAEQDGRRPAQSNGNGNGGAPAGRPAAAPAPAGPPSSSAPPPAANRGSGNGSRAARPAGDAGQSWFNGPGGPNAAPPRPSTAAPADAPTQIRSGGAGAPAPAAQPTRGKSDAEQATRPAGGGTRPRSPLTDPALVRPVAPNRPSGTGRAAAAGAAGAAGARAAAPTPAPERPREAPARPDAARSATPNRADAPNRPGGPTGPTGPTQDTVVGGRGAPKTEAFSRNSPPVATPEPPRAAPRQPDPATAAFAGAPTTVRPTEQPHQGDGYARPQEAPRRAETYDPGPEPYHPDLDPGTDANRGASRRAHLRVSRVSPKSVFKISFMFSLCVFVIIIVAVAVLWFVLDSIGVFHSIESAAQTLTDKSNGGIDQWLGFQRVIGISFIIGLVNVVLMTALSTLGALLYNLCTDLVGGVEVTLTER